MRAIWRWFKPEKARPAVAPAEMPDPVRIIATNERRPVPSEPPESAGLERIESRSHPGKYYYRNKIPDPRPGYPSIKGDALFAYEVVGESHYQEALERIVGGRRSAAVYFRVIAVLSSEPENPHDANAIMIRVNGEKVGYIKKQDNLALRNQLNALGISGDVQCRAEIAGGWDRGGGDIGKFGLKLDLDLNFPPDVRPAPKPPAPRKKH